MEQQISAKKLSQALKEMREISRMNFILYTKKGRRMAGTVAEKKADFQEAVIQFASSMAESQIIKNWIFLKIEVSEKQEYVLLAEKNGDDDTSYMIGRMAVCQIRNLFLAAQEPSSEVNFLRKLMYGEYSPQQILENNRSARLKNGTYQLYVIRVFGEPDEIVTETLKNMFLVYTMDYLVDVDDTRMVLIKNVKGMDVSCERYAEQIIDNLQSEAMVNVWVGYSDPAEGFGQFRQRFAEGCAALRIGRVFYEDSRVFYFRQLGIGRLISQLSADMCDLFLEEVFGPKKEVDLDEESLATINQLFANNLNISETARQMCLHRNTLVYRLERIGKKIGLDIRTFEDAMLFKIAMMVRTQRDTLDSCQIKSDVVE